MGWGAAVGPALSDPRRQIGNWLRGLTIDDAGLVARADGFGMLRGHLSGAALFPGLPPVAPFEDTVRWRVRHQPLHVPRAEVMPWFRREVGRN
jgi:hypothetical protein